LDRQLLLIADTLENLTTRMAQTESVLVAFVLNCFYSFFTLVQNSGRHGLKFYFQRNVRIGP
jgi:hypothetical protein